ncbi:MAG: arsenosugar biosynthesis radical SAM protein ArsS [Deltaproteobacteria bacterium]
MEAWEALARADDGSEKESVYVEPFWRTLVKHGLGLERGQTTTLQLNVGLLCNQVCKHCHLDAGPKRTELMDDNTLDHVVTYARQIRFPTIDITGGAPELHPNLIPMMEELSPLTDRLMIRSNLSALEEGDPDRFIDSFAEHKAVVLASLPAVNSVQTESQRGKGVFGKSIHALRLLNAAGYGQEGTGLELNLVSNPTGAFFPPSQAQAEERFRVLLKKRWEIVFNHLFTFANVPLGRFRRWLQESGNLKRYLDRLVSSFNPCVVEGLMCRTLVSVAWDGYLYDCDFNLAARLPMAGRKSHISDIEGLPEPGTPIAVADHCYTCAAGSGFT